MEGNAKIIKLIARDEALHLTGTQHILQHMAAGRDDPEMAEIAKECQGDVVSIFMLAARQEKFILNLENALVRIQNKTYGLCRVTGKLIKKERLKLVPHATLSMEAKLRQ